MKKALLSAALMAVSVTVLAQAPVYFTSEISASNQLKPELIRDFVNGLDGTASLFDDVAK